MSIKLMAQVWEIELSHSQQAVLLAMADYANDDGRNCYPSHRLLAWKTGYSDRQVARLINELIAEGVVKIIKPATNKQPPRYWIRLEKGKPKPPFDNDSFSDDESGGVILSPQENGGDTVSPQNGTQNGTRGDKMSPQNVAFVTSRGDIAMSPDPSVNHQYKKPTKKENERMNGAPEENSFIHSPPFDVSSAGTLLETSKPGDQVEVDDSFDLLTAPEVGLDEPTAHKLAAAYSFDCLLRHVFAWQAHRAKGGKYDTTGALLTRIRRNFSAPELTPEQKRTELFEQFHKLDYGSGDYVRTHRDYSEAAP